MLYSHSQLFVWSCYIATIIVISSFGFLFATVSYSQVQSIRDFDGTINSAIDNITRFVEYMQNVSFLAYLIWLANQLFLLQEVNITISRFDEVNAFLECEINSN